MNRPSNAWLRKAANLEDMTRSVSVGGLAADLGMLAAAGKVVLVGGRFDGMEVDVKEGGQCIVVEGEPAPDGRRVRAAYWRERGRAYFRQEWTSSD